MYIDIEINKKEFETHKYYKWESQYTPEEKINGGCIQWQVKLYPADIAIIKNHQKEH